MKKKIERNYLEINSIKDLKEKNFKSETYNVSLVSPPDFQINKFFYKNIGKNHKWLDRLEWSEKKWIEYISNILNLKKFNIQSHNIHDKCNEYKSIINCVNNTFKDINYNNEQKEVILLDKTLNDKYLKLYRNNIIK